jgi:hypothetical protein
VNAFNLLALCVGFVVAHMPSSLAFSCLSLVLTTALAFQPHAPSVLPATPRQSVRCVRMQQSEDSKRAAEYALRKAEEKLEELNKVDGKAPSSWADLGLPPEAEPAPAIPQLLQVAPLVLGGFSVLLFLLNAVGLFGDGPDLDALVEEWSNL